MKKTVKIILILFLVIVCMDFRSFAKTIPDDKDFITRAEFGQYLLTVLQEKGISTNVKYKALSFKDINKSNEIYEDILFLQNLSVIKGDPNSFFRPFDKITYEEAATMVTRFFITDENVNEKYGKYPEGYIKYALNKGLLRGVTAIVANCMTFQDAKKIVNNLRKNFITYDIIKPLGCDAYNGYVYIDYYPKTWQGFAEKPIATSDGYFKILPSKLLYSYDNKNWITVYEDIEGERIYYNLPENIDIKGVRYAWEYDAFVNVPFEKNKNFYSYDYRIWNEGKIDKTRIEYDKVGESDSILGIKKENILYDAKTNLYFAWMPYESNTHFSKRYKTTFQENKYGIIFVSEDSIEWKIITKPKGMKFFTSAGMNNNAKAIIIDGATEFTDNEKAYLDNEEKYAKNKGFGYDKPSYKIEKFILEFSDILKLF